MTGTPKNKPTDEAKALVKLAEERELENEKKRYRREGRDWEVERKEMAEREVEERRIEEEDEEWWRKLLSGYDEKGRPRVNTGIEGDGDEISKESREQGDQKEEDSKPDSAGESRTRDNDEVIRGKFTPFDPRSVPPGNLWPLFPSIGDMPSAHVDPWEALGPRSSSRRKWTEAQEHYKQVEKAKKKRYRP